MNFILFIFFYEIEKFDDFNFYGNFFLFYVSFIYVLNNELVDLEIF